MVDNTFGHMLDLSVRRVCRWAALLFACVLLLVSCGGKRESVNFGELASRIKAGMSQDEVLQVAGEPTNKLEFAWVYKNPDSVGEVLVVVFRDGKVEGVRHYTPPVDETLPAGEADPSGFGGAAGG